MRLLFSVIAALASALVALVTGPVLLTSAWLDFTADRTHPEAVYTYRVYADVAPAFVEAASLADFQLLQLPRSLSTLVVGEDVEAATSVSKGGELAELNSDREIPSLEVLLVDRTFPSFFEVRWAGERLERFGEAPQLWLTQTGAQRLRRALGGLPRTLQFNGQALQIQGVISDPPEGSHLDYEALVSGWPSASQSSALLYVKTRNPVAASEHLGPLVSQSIGLPGGVMRARLLPLTNLRLASIKQQYEASFVRTGRGLEFAVALSAGMATVVGGILALMLLVRSVVERRRKTLGVRVMLGRSPVSMAVAALSRFVVALVLILPVALWAAWAFGGGVLQALEKPNMMALRQVLVALSLGVAALVLVGAAIALSGLFMSSPSQLALRDPDHAQRTNASLILGLGGLSAGICLLMFAASQFATEVRHGAILSADANQVWSLQAQSPADLNRIRWDLERSALVSDVAVLGWRPFGGNRLNAAVAVEGGGLVQVTTLASETGWGRFWGARQLAGPRGVLDQLEGRTHCVAIAELTAAEALLPQDPLGVVGRQLRAGSGSWNCRIEAVIETTRRGKRALHGDPVIHMVNAPLVLETRTRDGQAMRHLLVRFRPGVSRSQMQEVLERYDLHDPPRTLVELGLAAYERERRISQIIVGSAILLAGVMLVVTLALTMDTLEAQSKSLAVRRALGTRPMALAYRAIRPSLWAVTGSGAAAVLISVMLAPFWRDWAGLAGQQWDMATLSVGIALALSTAPMAGIFVISVILISHISPARLIRDT